MKKTFRYLFILASLTSLLVSCDPDDNPPDDTDPRDKFVGSWSCNENSSENGISTFTVTITLNTGNSTQIYLSNFYGLTSNKVYAVIAGYSATIPSQAVSNFTISGSGTMTSTNTKIDWSYNVNDGADIDNCTAVFSK